MNEISSFADLLQAAEEIGIDTALPLVRRVLGRYEITLNEAAWLLGKPESYQGGIRTAIRRHTLRAREIHGGRKTNYRIRPADLIEWARGKRREEDRLVDGAAARLIWEDGGRVWRPEEATGTE